MATIIGFVGGERLLKSPNYDLINNRLKEMGFGDRVSGFKKQGR